MGGWWQSWSWIPHFLIKRGSHTNKLFIHLEDGLDSALAAGFGDVQLVENEEHKVGVNVDGMHIAEVESPAESVYRCFRAYEWLSRVGTLRFPICDPTQAYTSRAEQDPHGVLTNTIRLLPHLPPHLRGSRNHRLLQEAALLMLCHHFMVPYPMRYNAFNKYLIAFCIVGLTANDLYEETTALLNCMSIHQPHLSVLEVATEACHAAGGSRYIQFASIGCLSFIMRCCEACVINPLCADTLHDAGVALAVVALGLVAAVDNPPRAILGPLKPRVVNLRVAIYDCVIQQEQHFRKGCYGRSTSPHSRIMALSNIKTAIDLVSAESSSPVTVLDIV